jgi:hypothetical protein
MEDDKEKKIKERPPAFYASATRGEHRIMLKAIKNEAVDRGIKRITLLAEMWQAYKIKKAMK